MKTWTVIVWKSISYEIQAEDSEEALKVAFDYGGKGTILSVDTEVQDTDVWEK